MVNKRNKIIYKCVITLILLMITVASIAPFIYLAVTSFVSDMSLVFKNGIALKITPDMLDVSNYFLLWTEDDGLFFSWFKNSVCITILFTIISVLLSAMVGYGVQMYEFRGRKLIIIMIMSTMMIPLETLMIPLYNEVKILGATKNLEGFQLSRIGAHVFTNAVVYED